MSEYSQLSEEVKEKRRESCRRWAAKNDRKAYHTEYDKTKRDKVARALSAKTSRENNPESYKASQIKNYVKNRQNWKTKNTEQSMFASAKRRARVLSREFTITLDDIVIPEFCPIFTQLKLEKSSKRVSSNSPSLDRKNPSEGYTPNNIWVISHKANTMKSNATLDELKEFGQWCLEQV